VLERARTELELELGRKRVAQAEWQLYGAEQAEASQSLALREPQQKAAELSLRTAETGLEQAKIQHGRTLIKAPFDAVVRSNSTEAGRLVTPGQSLANLIDTSLFLVSVSVPPADLAWLKIPGTNAPALTRDIADKARAAEDPRAAFAELSSLVRVSQRIGNERIERSGVIIRMLGDLDPAGRMARLLVSVRDPLGREDQEQREGVAGLPILLGAYVTVEIEGRRVEDVVELPRVALREGNKVYLVSGKGTLDEREVEILHRSENSVLVKSGLSGGERVITSSLAAPVLGMELRVAAQDDGEADGPPRAQVDRDTDNRRAQ
jgi:multidrug efflux pump subunit AcrA (membrane-fusion protein)